MILVAGLAIAGLAGIAAAFYFSMRPGGSRVRAAGPGRAADSRVRAGRSKTSPPSGRGDRSASPARSATPARSGRPVTAAGAAGSGSGRATDRTGASTVIDFTGPQPVLDESEPPVAGRRARHGNRLDDAPDEREPGRQAAAQRLPVADTDDAGKTPRSHRRVSWRKGTDVDEELWPAEAFGGVSDEQFWDDLAADKPLATTARTAQPETAARRRPPNAGPLPDLRPAGSPLPDLRPGDDRSREDGRRSGSDGPGTHPQPQLGPDDRTAIQPAVQRAATAPVATQPYPTAAQPSRTATQPVRAAQQPAGSRGRSRATISADEDPLTSPAYSLRAKGSVDGRSRRPRDLSREQYEAAITQETQTFSMADAQTAGGGYPDGVPPFRQFDRPAPDGHGRSDPSRSGAYRSDPLRPDPQRSDHLRPDPLRPGDGYGATVPNSAYPYPQQAYGEPTSSVNAPPYGDRYGYGNPVGQASPVGDPRRANGGWSPGQAGGNGGGNGASRPGYPPVNGYRGPYDPPGYDRRLTTQR
jgi:hypothetical protein